MTTSIMILCVLVVLLVVADLFFPSSSSAYDEESARIYTLQLQRRDTILHLAETVGKPDMSDGTYSAAKMDTWKQIREMERIDDELKTAEQKYLAGLR